MESKLFFSCSYKSKENKWVILADREDAFKLGKDKILSMINFTKGCYADAKLEFIPEPRVGLSELKMESDREKYLFHLTEYDQEGDYIVRVANLDISNTGFIYFHGEPFPASSVITDFEFIKKVFIQLLDTGNVSRELME